MPSTPTREKSGAMSTILVTPSSHYLTNLLLDSKRPIEPITELVKIIHMQGLLPKQLHSEEDPIAHHKLFGSTVLVFLPPHLLVGLPEVKSKFAVQHLPHMKKFINLPNFRCTREILGL
ncbi:uncharacterized protein DS421_5g159740 [Arachis hypogaea]|nr:uncharacterized protein DS421_5g159740 [Arachis hypogaea]